MDLKKWERSLKGAIGGFAAGFLALAVWKRVDYVRHPGNSAPFWVFLLPSAALAAALIILAAVLLVLVRRKRLRQEKNL